LTVPQQHSDDRAPTKSSLMTPLHSLTALRFFAALYILVYHRRDELSGYANLLDRIVANGFVGVPLFFVLSGFVLAYNYVGRDGRLGSGARSFYVARMARIYPVYLLAFVLFAPTAFGTRAIPAEQWTATVASTLTMTQSWTELIYWNRPGWTISTEVFFYLAFPVLAPLVCRVRGAGLIAAAATFWLLGMIPVILQDALVPDDALWIRIVKHNPLARLPEFLIGVATGKLFIDRARGHGRGWMGGLAIALVGIATAVTIETTGVWYVLWHNGFLAPLYALLVYALALGDAVVTRLPGWRTLTRLGDASYGIYILQTPIHSLCMAAVTVVVGGSTAARHASVENPAFVAAYTLVLIGVALVSLRWYEAPARAAIRRLATATTTPRQRARTVPRGSAAPPFEADTTPRAAAES
jgi:peptidoglycan/LPS O-acetylase OafA/YrhL